MLTFQAMDTLNIKNELSENIYFKVKCILLSAEETIKSILHYAAVDIKLETSNKLDSLFKEIDSYKSAEHETLFKENERLREEIKHLNETMKKFEDNYIWNLRTFLER